MTGNCAHKSYMVPGDPKIRSTAAHMTTGLICGGMVCTVMQADAQSILLIGALLDR